MIKDKQHWHEISAPHENENDTNKRRRRLRDMMNNQDTDRICNYIWYDSVKLSTRVY